jgi:hypothetical protein
MVPSGGGFNASGVVRSISARGLRLKSHGSQFALRYRLLKDAPEARRDAGGPEAAP